jgi:hypothetical protein
MTPAMTSATTTDPIAMLKGRMAEALVEAIFKRAGYTVARVGHETPIPALVPAARSGFTPAFVVWRALDEPSLGHHSYRLLALDVTYCTDLDDYLRRESPARSAEMGSEWPELYGIVVVDRPEAGRSCFQAIHVSVPSEGIAPATLDLHLVPGLDIYRKMVEEYEGLVREIFPILGSRDVQDDAPRKPSAWMGRRSRGGHRQSHPVADAHRYRPSLVSEHRPGASE